MTLPGQAICEDRLSAGMWLNITRWSAVGGGAVWLIYVALNKPSPFDPKWAVALLLLSPLVLVPTALRLSITDRDDRPPLPWRCAVGIQPVAAIALLVAFTLPRGIGAALATLPWLIFTGIVALFGVYRFREHAIRDLDELCIDAGLVFLAIGGAWATLSRLGVRPLGFKDIIVLLTAIHFHYAGLVLPLLTGLAGRVSKTFPARLAAVCVMAGVPLVATGITATQLGLGSFIECAAAWITALGGLLTAWLHFQLAAHSTHSAAVRSLWAIAGSSLGISMALAAAYGSRAFVDVAWLDIPWMRAIHGTANALGFALGGMVAWDMALHGGADREDASSGSV